MQNAVHSPSRLPAIFQWTGPGRTLVFFLSAASIWCLLAEMYKLCDMQTFTIWILIPCTLLLIAIAGLDRLRGDRRLWQACVIGALGGLLAAVAYDLFRLPWVIGYIDQQGPLWLRLPLYKVFPRFGAMILGHAFTNATTDSQFTLTDHVVGWIYHFSNGITFGVMYMAIIGNAVKRTWLWGIVLAVGLEIFLLISPYSGFFAIKVTALFVVVTLTAHLLFGIALGWYARQAESGNP